MAAPRTSPRSIDCILHHFAPLCLTAHHFTSLMLTLSHCGSLCLTVAHSVSLCASLRTTLRLSATLCTSVPHSVWHLSLIRCTACKYRFDFDSRYRNSRPRLAISRLDACVRFHKTAGQTTSTTASASRALRISACSSGGTIAGALVCCSRFLILDCYRSCGGVFCSGCSDNIFELADPQGRHPGPKRVCDECFNELEGLRREKQYDKLGVSKSTVRMGVVSVV